MCEGCVMGSRENHGLGEDSGIDYSSASRRYSSSPDTGSGSYSSAPRNISY